MTAVAIDGPAGAGKSTVARLVAEQIEVPYLDTGAMYRCVAFAVLQQNVSHHDGAAVASIAENIKIILEHGAVYLDGVDVSSEIRTPEVGSVVSVIAAMSPVRDAMRSQQQKWITEHHGGVVEGRDMLMSRFSSQHPHKSVPQGVYNKVAVISPRWPKRLKNVIILIPRDAIRLYNQLWTRFMWTPLEKVFQR